MFDRAFLQMIQHLIADNARFAGNLSCLFKIRHVEVAHAIGEYFALLTERVNAANVSSSGCGPRQCSR